MTHQYAHHQALQGQDCHWNSDRPIVYAAVVLQKSSTVHSAGDICRNIAQQMDLWDEGKWHALIDDIESKLLKKVSAQQHAYNDNSISWAYSARVLSGCGFNELSCKAAF